MTIQAIPTWYAGYKFRSRLEARWAVFFDSNKIRWEYEVDGFLIKRPGHGTHTPYLPDFRLSDCGTWIEVKGAEEKLDRSLMWDAAAQLPRDHSGGEQGPSLLVVGPIPRPSPHACGPYRYDWGWPAPERAEHEYMTQSPANWPHDWVRDSLGGETYYGFGSYHKNCRPWFLDNVQYEAYRHDPVDYSIPADRWLTPIADTSEVMHGDIYQAARSARFEHGESGSVLT